ncbi:hypothetical protein CGU36_27945, partial [Pseudomonas fluorescens]
WECMRYRVQLRGSRLRVEVRPDEVELECDSAVEMPLEVWGQSVSLKAGQKCVVKKPK